MEDMDTFSSEKSIDYDEIADVEEKTKLGMKRVQIMSIFIEHAHNVSELDNEELYFYDLAEQWWRILSVKQRNMVFLHIVQKKSHADISEILSVDIRSIYRVLDRAFSKSRHLFSRKK